MILLYLYIISDFVRVSCLKNSIKNGRNLYSDRNSTIYNSTIYNFYQNLLYLSDIKITTDGKVINFYRFISYIK